ncbi:hypothetical protein C2845_PM02G12550 [Panicum miliaceum]|uniref:Uncharacterized protein n=1 Tax=Panicum miliaceum TaxID=4540 RepID=A0A3L6S8S8_PANMI|nr:hypothetical protein C2845_PM02G12550 [Panicum miliaceum]
MLLEGKKTVENLESKCDVTRFAPGSDSQPMHTKVLKEKQFLEPRSVMHVLDGSVESLVIYKGTWLHAVLQWIVEVGERERATQIII